MTIFKPVTFLGALAVLAALPFILLPQVSRNDAQTVNGSRVSPSASRWAAVAPGRVEPQGGEVRIGSELAGRIVEVAVQLNDRVEAGDLLAKLDDGEAAARLAAAAAEVGNRKLVRESRSSGSRADRRQRADDAVWESEQRIYAARGVFDRAMAEERAGKAEKDAVSKARSVLGEAERQFVKDRTAAAEFAADKDMPQPNSSEGALAAARAQMAAAQAGFERTRIRAPSSGTVLQMAAKAGELAAPSAEQSLFVIGDVSSLRVRVEIEERDIDKVRPGQKIVVRADTFKDKEFKGSVTSVAGTLTSARLAPRGMRRLTEQDVLEVFATLDDRPPLISGMRVDVFFEPDAPAAVGSAKP